MASSSEPNVLFFLGAGASVAAGVPDTFRLVDDFLEELKSTGKDSELLNCRKIIEVLEASELASDRKVDVELLLEALDQLENEKKSIPLYFHEGGKSILGKGGQTLAGNLKRELRDFIKRKGLVNQECILYLKDLLFFNIDQPQRPLDVFSVNYDVCIEQLCDAFKKGVCRRILP